MATYSTNEFKRGLKIMLDGDPYNIVENEFVKPAKGQAFNRVKVRNLKTGRTIERTFKSGESVEAADVMDTDMQYLYNDGEAWHFMHPETFEQIAADASAIGDEAKWLKEQDICVLTLWNGDTATGGTKPAICDTGAVVQVPLFIDVGDLLKVDTRSGEYISRAKE